MEAFLQLNDVNAYYGDAQALHGVTLTVQRGEIVSLLGRNGVGKSTTLKSIMGLVKVKGDIVFNHQRLNEWPPYKISQAGIGWVPEERRIFPSLTVKENLLVGMAKEGEWGLKQVFELFPVLEEKQNRPGTMMSGGEQQMLAIARCLMANPQLLLLDEPCEGLAPIVVQELEKAVRKLKEKGLTILLVEQSLHLSKRLADRHYLLSKGMVCFHGTSEELFQNTEVLEQYLGI